VGRQFHEIGDDLQVFIRHQKIFFVATAAPDGCVNVSPKGMDTLHIPDKHRVLWLNLTGSGNETAAHLLENNRMTVMFCAFEGEPLILRLYGQARTVHPRDEDWEQLLALFPQTIGARQIFDMQVDLVQTSCGAGVPYFDFVGERNALINWAEKKGPAGLEDYWREKNRISLDGKPTGILKS